MTFLKNSVNRNQSLERLDLVRGNGLAGTRLAHEASKETGQTYTLMPAQKACEDL